MTKKSSTVSGAIKRGAGNKSSNQRSAIEDQAITRVRALAWTGQHAPAIDLATQALSALGKGDSRVAPTMIDLLDLRAESYIAQGKLDLANKDAKAMVKIAKTGGLPLRGLRDTPHKVRGATRPLTTLQSPLSNLLIAQALNRLALVQMRTGDLKAAVKSATSAVRTVGAGTSRPRKGREDIAPPQALALFRLSEAQMRTGQNEASIESAQKAIALFQSTGDHSGTGRAYWSLANACFNLSRADDSRRAAYTALEICKQAGDQYGIGNALNAITLTDVGIAERTQHTQQALQAFEMAGYVERQSIALGTVRNAARRDRY